MSGEKIDEYRRKIAAYVNSERFERQWREFRERLDRESITVEQGAAHFEMPIKLFRLFYGTYLAHLALVTTHLNLMDAMPPTPTVHWMLLSKAGGAALEFKIVRHRPRSGTAKANAATECKPPAVKRAFFPERWGPTARWSERR
jgi:hypothetical protein